MKLGLLGSTALVALAANTVVHAADMRMSVKAPIAPVFSWNGYYAGVVAGYSWRDPTIEITGNVAATATYLATGTVPSTIPVDPKGGLVGVQAGVNYQSGSVVFGFETDISYANIRDGGTAGPGSPLNVPNIFFCGKGLNPCFDTFRFNSTAEQELNWFGTIRTRLGVTPVERVLLFVTGGLAYGLANLSASVLNVSGTQTTLGGTTALPSCTQICATGSTREWLVGWTIGGGIEFAFNNFWTGKIEYLYYDLGDLSVSFSDPRFASFVFNATAQFRGNIVRAAWSYKFN